MALRVEEPIKSRDEPLGSRLTERNGEDRDGCQSQVTPRIYRGFSPLELCAPIADRIAIWRERGGVGGGLSPMPCKCRRNRESSSGSLCLKWQRSPRFSHLFRQLPSSLAKSERIGTCRARWARPPPVQRWVGDRGPNRFRVYEDFRWRFLWGGIHD
jgi:hypothetical protein